MTFDDVFEMPILSSDLFLGSEDFVSPFVAFGTSVETFSVGDAGTAATFCDAFASGASFSFVSGFLIVSLTIDVFPGPSKLIILTSRTGSAGFFFSSGSSVSILTGSGSDFASTFESLDNGGVYDHFDSSFLTTSLFSPVNIVTFFVTLLSDVDTLG